jgi:hypothetical protein
MCPRRRHPIRPMVSSPFRRSQQQTLALVSAAIAKRAQATSLAVAGYLTVDLGTQLGSALNHCHRLLRNPPLDVQRLTAQALRLLGRVRRLLIALHWMEWHDALRLLVTAVVLCCRAIPVQTAVFQKIYMVRSQRTWEHTSSPRPDRGASHPAPAAEVPAARGASGHANGWAAVRLLSPHHRAISSTRNRSLQLWRQCACPREGFLGVV